MASIVDSFREVLSDRLAILKLIILAIPAVYVYSLYLGASVNHDYSGFYQMLYITLFIYFGVLARVTNNVVNERDFVLPSFNPLPVLFDGIKGLLAILPSALISCLLANYVCSFINIVMWVDITLKSLIWLVVASIIITSFLMYSSSGKILDAFNVKVLFEKAGDIIVMLIFFIIQLVVINIPTTAFIGYTLLILFGFGPLFNFYVALAIVFNICVMGHYFGQMHYETITYMRPKN